MARAQPNREASMLGKSTLSEVKGTKGDKKVVQVTDRHGNVVKIEIGRAPAMQIQRISASIERPQRPTYTATLYGGSTQELPLDEEAAKQFAEDGTEEGLRYYRRWQDYVQAENEAEAQYMERMMRAMFLSAAKFDLPADQSFFDEDVFLGFDVPKEERFRKVHYLMNHLLDADVIALMTTIMGATGVDEKVVAEAEAAFRGSVREGDE